MSILINAQDYFPLGDCRNIFGRFFRAPEVSPFLNYFLNVECQVRFARRLKYLTKEVFGYQVRFALIFKL